ncbi:hypothetical protein ARMSODRAFT_956363 [Armillaria solidipes]|uniref:Uncharacterized protein n=1 Tax=Armillaria solidipes TaxID=1076256 RepID=A0A2H3BW44_9AGAR|nr:hypothetical protein ARMSODRAFT_956363 [Armillaria solidipes]
MSMWQQERESYVAAQPLLLHRIYGRKAVIRYGSYGPHPYRKPYRKVAVKSPDGTGTVPYIRYPYPPYIR